VEEMVNIFVRRVMVRVFVGFVMELVAFGMRRRMVGVLLVRVRENAMIVAALARILV
jgi:hypothetical protein